MIIAVAFDMTFANRNRGGTLAYARALFNSMGDRDDVVAWAIGGPRRSGIAGTMRWLLRGARRELSSRRPDILHCPAFVAPWGVDVPTVVTVHDAATRRFPEDHPLEWRVYDRRLLPGRLRGAARVITGSEFARREVIGAYGLDPSRVVAVPYGLNPKFLEGDKRRVRRDEATLLFPGAPVGRKNLEAVLRCMSRAAAGTALSRACLEISGATAADFPHHARQVEALGLTGRVRWLGQVPAEELIAAMAGATAVVYPSFYEGFGFPPLEAMAVGTPVVASDRGSLPEVLGDAALMVDPADDGSIAQALERVLSDPALRDDLVARGRAQAGRFTWQACAEKTLGVYRSVLGERVAAA